VIILGGFFFQPSELVKLSIIIALAKYFDDHIIEGRYKLRELYIPFLIVVVPFLFILKQPDLGTALILMFLILSITFFIGIEWKSLILACTGGMILIPLSWLFLRDYQKERS